MDCNQLTQACRILQRKGYEIDSTGILNQGYYLIVKDPVMCSNGVKRWKEHEKVTLRSMIDVDKFLHARS